MGTERWGSRRTGGRRRPTALVAAGLLTAGGAVTFLTPAAPASADPLDTCTATTGAIVAVDFGPFGGKLERGCDATPTTGYQLLRDAGFTTAGTVKDGPAFICRIGKPSFNSGTQYPTPAAEACKVTPPASAYWSYWIASPGQKNWTYSPLGAMARRPKHGDVDAWVFGATSIDGTKGRPKFTPADVRAGTVTPPEPTDPSVPQVPPGSVSLENATRWLAGRLTDGERVVDEPSEYRNHQATAEIALALTAVDAESPVARKAAAYLARPEVTDAYLHPEGDKAAPDTTAAARLALVAEATGGDPRSFGGRDLLADLLKNVCETGSDAPAPVPGCAHEGDFRTSNDQAEGQALALVALLSGGVTPPAGPVTRLTELQCEDGGFSSMLIPPLGACDSEAGATGLAVLALQRAGGHDSVVKDARAYLRKAQLPTGALPAVWYNTTGSPYATGFAAQALRALGDTARADAAVSWLSRQQLGDGGFPFEEGGDALLYATTPAVIAGAKSDLVTLTGGTPEPTPTEPTEPTPTEPTPTRPTPTGPNEPSGPSPDLAKGTAYLTDPSRLLQGRYYENTPGTGTADFGLTIDGAYALAATGTDDNALRAVVDFLDKNGRDGTGRGLHDWTGIGTEYAGGGSIGKAAVLAEAVGRDPRNFGGRDLIAALAEAVCAAKTPAPDRSCAARGNYAYATSVFSQSLGVIAQVRAGESAAAADPAAYLRSLQEPSGAWPSLIGEPSGVEVDSTAMAAMALDLLPDAASQAAVDKALVWLASQQKTDGGFPGASGNSVNSAALAIQGLALDAPSYEKHMAKARAFLASQQNADGGFNVAKGGQPGSDVRASTQALGGTTGISFGTLSRSLDGTTAPPAPSGSPTTPVIVTPGEAGGTGGNGGTGNGTGGSLAATGTRATALAAAALLLVLAGYGTTRAARRRRTAPGEQG
ncbi:prenyltransferase/squalene oxidase repeat-containing protein [Streptomyces sp. NPDC090093]|uniref:prenyltransferase/squalene oxidase repeat-containing protein n=1 Tax=Streptomyces sp. NPDC090093 TaxID=3365945 RepID=UPI0037F7F6B5